MRVSFKAAIFIFLTFQTMSCDVVAAAASKKVVIRNHIKEVLKSISIDEIGEKSAAIVSRLHGMPEYKDSSCVCLYLSMPAGEVQSYELLQQAFGMKKRVFIPKVTGKKSEDLKIFEIKDYSTINDFPKSKWGIPEPTKEFTENAVDATYLGLVDCVIMPGVAFDSRCARIGHGKGYYDCFLERISAANLAAGKSPPRTIAIAFDEQILEDHSIPMEAHDKFLNFVITPTHTYKSS